MVLGRLAPAVDPKARTVRAEVDLPNPDGKLLPGLFGSGTLVLEYADVWTIKKLTLMQKKFITTDQAQAQALQKEIDATDKKAKELYEKRKADAAQAG